MIFAVFSGNGYENEYCRGIIMAEEGKTLFLHILPTLMESLWSPSTTNEPKQQALPDSGRGAPRNDRSVKDLMQN